MGLSDGGRISTILSAVLIQYTRVTDGQTDTRNWRGIAYMLSRVKTLVERNLRQSPQRDHSIRHMPFPIGAPL